MTRTLLAAAVVVGCGVLVLAGPPETPPAVFTEAQVVAGRAAYESVCVNCHTYAVTGRKGDPGELPVISSLAAYFLHVSGAHAGTQELGTPGTMDILIRDVTASIAAR
jgi:mono/diheme cytochrome c family protein